MLSTVIIEETIETEEEEQHFHLGVEPIESCSYPIIHILGLSNNVGACWSTTQSVAFPRE